MCPVKIPEVGTRFCALTFQGVVDKAAPENARWSQSPGRYGRFLCACGATTVRLVYPVFNGVVMSCGCQSHKKPRRFGLLSVAGPGSTPHRVMCRCDCGTVVEVFRTNLYGGRTKSCGCLRGKTANK